MDIDLDDEVPDIPSRAGYTTLPPQEVVFDSRQEQEREQVVRAPSTVPVSAPPEGEEDAWANLG